MSKMIKKYTVHKVESKWQVWKYLGRDKMEQEFKTVGIFYSEKEASDYRDYLLLKEKL